MEVSDPDNPTVETVFSINPFMLTGHSIEECFYRNCIIIDGMRIRSLATTVPANEYTTDQLLTGFPTLPEGVKQNVLNLGVKKRHLVESNRRAGRADHVLSEKDLVDLCRDASERAISTADICCQDIGYLITTYDANPVLSPGLSHLLVPELRLNSQIKHVSLQGVASTAFPKALDLAESRLLAHPQESVLICISGVSSYWFQTQINGALDVMEIGQISRITDAGRRARELRKWVAIMEYFLFGDGVAAVLVTSNTGDTVVKKTVEITNLSRQDYLAGYMRVLASEEPFMFELRSHLDKEIPRLGTLYTGKAIETLLGPDAGNIANKVRKWVVHTGSEKILNALAERNKIVPEKLRESHEILNEFGNLAGASLPFILERVLAQQELSVGDRILMVGYGWGFSAAASLLEIC